GVEVQIRVGRNSGEVVVRAIGNDLHMDYSAIGETTHLAARMEQLAPPGTIRLTAATLRLVEGFMRGNALGPVPVQGTTAPVEVRERLRMPPGTNVSGLESDGGERFFCGGGGSGKVRAVRR
ncbi:adenylate/guanylate cyclase domain-containing protein, partial [Lacticaseibacillus rhamnosus]